MRTWTAVGCLVVFLSFTLLWESTQAQDAVQYEDAQNTWMQESSNNARADDLSGSQLVNSDVELSAAASSRRRRRRKKNNSKARQRQQQQQQQEDQDYYYDRDDEYGAPKAPASSYAAPAPSYNPPAPSYSPPSYAAPSDGYGAPAYDDGGGGGGDGFNDFLNALAAFLPIGLFLAAIPPNIITINTDTGRKRRDLNADEMGNEVEQDYAFPFLKELQSIGYDKLEEPECQKKFFCKMATYGGRKDANYVQKSFNYVSNLFPAFLARPVGLDDLIDAVQYKHCDAFNCKA